jgi:deazaflavin-dependent oxidoreductase (nitroreductase family)
MPEQRLTWFQRLVINLEDIIMTRLVPMHSPGVVFKWLFRVPIFFYRIGLPVFGSFVLLLTTKGRKSGRPRHTPLEYHREPDTGDLIIMAGWGGNTDWRRNIQADPYVRVQAGCHRFEALAEPLSDAEVAASLAEVLRLNPASASIWSRWAGEPVNSGSTDSLLRAARFFPCFRLKPLPDESSPGHKI